MRNKVFVFSSNLLGIHGAGSALKARQMFGAQLRVGVGRTGDAYAIPTKRRPTMKSEDIMSIDQIKPHVDDFLQYARLHPEIDFEVVKIGCGLAGFSESQMAPLFKGAPNNCHLPKGWRTLSES